MLNHTDAEEDSGTTVRWDLTNHTHSVSRVPRSDIPANNPREVEKVVYVDTSPGYLRLNAMFAAGGGMLGMLLLILVYCIFGPHGTLSTGVKPIHASRVLLGITADTIKQLNLGVAFQAPTVTTDVTMLIEHGDGSDMFSEDGLLCNIYQDSSSQRVFGVEFIVDSMRRPVQDEDKLCDTANRFFADALPLLGDQHTVARAEEWVKTTVRNVKNAGAVSRTTYGKITLTCYGTPWTRTLILAPG